jgi:hypothetical protein
MLSPMLLEMPTSVSASSCAAASACAPRRGLVGDRGIMLTTPVTPQKRGKKKRFFNRLEHAPSPNCCWLLFLKKPHWLFSFFFPVPLVVFDAFTGLFHHYYQARMYYLIAQSLLLQRQSYHKHN